MKIIVLHMPNDQVERALLQKMFSLRARVFRGRLNWDVSVVAGEERDEFDELDPHYLLAVGERDEVLGTARLLPTIGPTMLERKFPILLTQGRLEPHSRMVESSRFCVDTRSPGRSVGLLHDATLSLFAAIIDWSMRHGYEEIVTATDIRFERLLRHAGWPMKRLGEPQLIGNVKSIAGILPADAHSFERIRPPTYRLEERLARSAPWSEHEHEHEHEHEQRSQFEREIVQSNAGIRNANGTKIPPQCQGLTPRGAFLRKRNQFEL